MDLKTAIRITADAQEYLAGMEKARVAGLRTFRDLRAAVEPARQAWIDAQAEVKRLASAMASGGPASADQSKRFAEAVAAAGALKARYTELRNETQAQRAALAQNATAIDGARNAYAQAAAEAERLKQSKKGLRDEAVTLSTTMQGLALAVAGVFGVGSARGLVELIDQYGQLNARVKMVSESFSAQADNMRGVAKVAMENGVAVTGVGAFYVRTSQALRAYNMEQSRAMVVTDLAGKALRINSGTVYGNAAALEQLVQAIGSGRLQGDELRSLSEQAPRLAQAIADGLGVPIGKLKELGSQGALTSQQVIQALVSQRDVLTAEAERIPLTLSQSAQGVRSALEMYVGGVDQASGVSRGLGAALMVIAKNMDIVVPSVTALTVALGVLAASSAVRMLAGLALGAGPVALGVAAAAAAAAGLWLALGAGEPDVNKAKGGLKELTDEVRDFSQNWDKAQREIKAEQIRKAIEETKAALKGLGKVDRESAIGDMYRQQIFDAEKSLEKLREVEKQKPLLLEKTALGLSDTGMSGGFLLDKKQAEALNAFEATYKAFVDRKLGLDGKLIVGQQEVKRALSTMIGGAKTTDDFEALMRVLNKASETDRSALLVNTIGRVAEARRQAEAKALDEQVAGLKARAEQARATFQSMVDQVRLAGTLATAIDQVTADARGDVPAQSALQVAAIRTTVQAAQQAAQVQISLIDQVAARKRAQIEEEAREQAARVAAQTERELKEESRKFDVIVAARDEIARAPASDANTKKDAERAKEQVALFEAGLEAKKRRAEEAANAEEATIRRIADLERATFQERLGVLRSYQQEVSSKANDALTAYRNYAQRVIELDRQIAQARVDQAASISALQRRDMNPTQQADSLREELGRVQSETAAARRDGDRQLELEMLSRQRSLATELAGVQGEGIDPKALRAEAISNLERIGGESMAVLKEQRAEAQAAAEQQRATFEQLAAAAQKIGAEIAKINAGETIKLQAEVDMASVTTAVDAVRQAFSKETFAIKVAATAQALPTGTDPVARAYGGPIFGPGSGTSDSIPALLSNGEHVLTAAEVRAAGGHRGIYAIRAALLGGWMPRFADGGAVGRVNVPELLPSARDETGLQPMVIQMPGGEAFPVQAAPDVAAAMDRHIRMQVLKRGALR